MLPCTRVRPERVLIVDDNLDAAFLLAELLKLRGHETIVAHDGLSALDLAIAEHPDVAVVDIGLPGIDGYELAKRIHATMGARAPRMIALTGFGRPQDRARSTAAGFVGHLTKPVDTATLVQLFDARAS